MIALILPDELWADADADTEALLEQWLVAEGETVRAGQVVATAVVVKTNVELIAPADGVLAAILVPAGDTFARGVAVGRLTTESAAVAAPHAAPPDSMDLEDVIALPEAAAPPPPSDVQLIPFTGMRGSIARNLSLAWQAPRVAMGLEVDITETMGQLEALRAAAGGPRVTLTALIVRAAALALRAHPGLNAHVSEAGVALAEGIHIAIAVSLDDGLVTPVVRDADRKAVPVIAEEIAELAAAARAGLLSPGALQGGTFTVSNLGGAGVDWFTPVLNPPQAAILGVGRAREAAVARGGQLVAATLVTLTLVFDHRAVDGDPAARFLAELGRLLAAGDL